MVECTGLEESTYEGHDIHVGIMEAGLGCNMDMDVLLNTGTAHVLCTVILAASLS